MKGVSVLPALAAALLSAGCGGRPADRPALTVGGIPLPAGQLDEAVDELRHTFPGYGTDTLRWDLLRKGMLAATLLHARHAEESRAARKLAEFQAGLLRRGGSFPQDLPASGSGFRLERAWTPMPPTPYGLGARAAAAVSTMEPGEWRGPLKTRQGWEILYLEKRFEGERSRAAVVVHRLVFPVGPPEAARKAGSDWEALPLEADPAYREAIPLPLREKNRPSAPETRP
ncbi:MAG: hypothetical protein ACE5H3_00050 [Planctomycetota bacterium]